MKMTKFDREMKKRAKNFQVPDTYHQKVDELLDQIQQNQVAPPKKKGYVKVAAVVAALCLVLTFGFFLSSKKTAQAGFFETFKQTVMDFLGIEKEDSEQLEIKSKKETAVSKPDLMMELQEVVMDTQNIYAVVKITAPTDIVFDQKMTFDYYGFCDGSNYTASKVVPGAKSCSLLETMDTKKNVATYVINVATDSQVKEGNEVTVFFKDLIDDATKKKPTKLIEGMWSLSFTAEYTSKKNITIKGTDSMQYPLLDSVAYIKKIKILPLGMTMISDISNVDLDTLHITDTRFPIRFKMLDGSIVTVDSPELDVDTLTDESGESEYQKKGKTYRKYVCQFRKAQDISKIVGIYVSDCYVPVKNYE